MRHMKVGFALLAMLLPLLLNASHFIQNDLINTKASKIIEEIGDELSSKTGIHIYVIATNKKLPVGFNMVAYSKRLDGNISKPYVILVFAPNAMITAKSEDRGRVGLIASSNEVKALYDAGDVKDATIDVVATKDANTKQDKYNIGVVQGYSELADQIADARGVEMTKTLPNETRTIISVLQVLVIFGSILVLWIFMIRPIIVRIKHGKQ